jgi:hypothetical protein
VLVVLAVRDRQADLVDARGPGQQAALVGVELPGLRDLVEQASAVRSTRAACSVSAA